MSSVTESYRESRFSGAHVHLSRFAGLYAVLVVSFALAVFLVMAVGSPTGVVGSGRFIDNWVIPSVGLAVVLSWLPAAVLTAGWWWRDL
jgi:hypothetical protein